MQYWLACGSRAWTNQRLLDDTLEGHYSMEDVDDEVRLLHGAARGADVMAGAWAERRGLRTKAMPADWDRHGRRAGYVRNAAMVDLMVHKQAEGHDVLVFAFATPRLDLSRGTAHTVDLALDNGLIVVVVESEPLAVAC